MTLRKRCYLICGAVILLLAAITCRVRTYFDSGTGVLSCEVSVFAVRVAAYEVNTLIKEQFNESGVNFTSRRWLVGIEGIMPGAFRRKYDDEIAIPLRFYESYRTFVMFLQSKSVPSSQQAQFYRQIDKSLSDGVLCTIAVRDAEERAITYLVRGGR